MTPPGALPLALFVLLSSVGILRAEDQAAGGSVGAVFWIDLEPIAKEGAPWPLSPAEGAAQMLDEAAWVFSGMLFGFEFSYTPLDRTRAIAERFDLVQLGTIPKGDRRIVPGPASGNFNELRARIEFHPDPGDLTLMESYSRSPWKPAQGIGTGDYMLGHPARRLAYEEGLREAARSLLRLLEPNKPRLVKGRIVLDRVPAIVLASGRYKVQVRARVQVMEVLSYNAY